MHDDERRAHPGLRDHRPPRRALDPPAEAVDEQHLEDEVDGVRDDHDHERRLQVGDAPQVALAAEREEREREPERRDPHVGDGVVGRVAVDSHQLDDLRCERDHAGGDRETEAERQPERLRAEPVRDLRLPRSRRAPDLRRRPVLEEVEDAEEAAEHRGRNPERRQLRAGRGGRRSPCRRGGTAARPRARRAPAPRASGSRRRTGCEDASYSARTMRAPLDCASALTTISSMFTCGGRVSANRTQSATSSGVTGSRPA